MLNQNQHRETLPLFQWFTGEARYFLAEPEEREEIVIHLHEIGQFGDQALLKWELEL